MPDKWLFYVWGLRFKKSWCEACTSCRITSEEFRVTANYIESVTQDSHVGNLTIVVQKFYVLPYLFLNIHDFQGTLKLSREPTTSRCSLLQHWTPTLALLIGGYFWIHFVPDLFLTKLVRFFNVEWRDSPPTRVRSPLITARPNDLRPHLIELTHSPLSALKSYKIFERSGFTPLTAIVPPLLIVTGTGSHCFHVMAFSSSGCLVVLLPSSDSSLLSESSSSSRLGRFPLSTSVVTGALASRIPDVMYHAWRNLLLPRRRLRIS